MATDYFTKWIEAIPIKRAISKVVIEFLMDNLLRRFGVLMKLIMDYAMYFRSEELIELCGSYRIIMSYSLPYHP